MNGYVEIDPDTGEILRAGVAADVALLPGYDPQAFKVLDNPPSRMDDVFWDGSQVVPKPARPGPYHTFDYGAKRWRFDLAKATEILRLQRDNLLAASDWVSLRAHDHGEQVPSQWLAYRRALRDLPANVTDEQSFNAVQWPQAPQ